jgi:hypothetical protein
LNLLGKNLQTEHIYEFFELKKRSPVMSDSGVTNDTTLIWLYALTKFIDPEIIVESGVYLGKSLWMLRQAAPNAEIHAYDISLKQLRFTDDTIHLHEDDWQTDEKIIGTPRSLCYFDDHINNCQRMMEAHARRFTNLIFDDSPCTMNLKHFRYPGVPTAQMLLDDWLQDGDKFIWDYKGTQVEYTFREPDKQGIDPLLDRIFPLPSLHQFLGINYSNLNSTFVKLL